MMKFKFVGERADGNIGAELTGQLGTAFQSTGTYVGGQPVGLGPSGLVFGEDLYNDCCRFIGVLYNDSLTDTNNGLSQKVTTTDLSAANPTVVYPGQKIGIFQGGTRSGTNDTFVTDDPVVDANAPYENVNWDVGDDVYVSSGGLWTNVSGNCTTSWGKVSVAPSSYGDELVFQFQQSIACAP